MALTQDEARAAKLFINKVIASNNPAAAVRVLKKYGYKTQFDVLSADQIEKALLELLYGNPSRYYAVMQEIPYRQDITNWTTSPDTKQKIRNIAYKVGLSDATAKGDVNWQEIWGTVVSSLGGTTMTNPDVVTETSGPALKPGTIILISSIGILAIFLIWFLNRKTA